MYSTALGMEEEQRDGVALRCVATLRQGDGKKKFPNHFQEARGNADAPKLPNMAAFHTTVDHCKIK